MHSERLMHIEQPDEWVVERWPAPFGDLLLVADSSGRMRALDLHGDEARLAAQFRARYGARVMLRSGAVPEAIRRALAAYAGRVLRR